MPLIFQSRSLPPYVPPGGSPDVTPSLVVEYVNTSGVRQKTTVVSGVTSITGVAPFFIHLDAKGSRSTADTTQLEAWDEMGYRINYGESLGTTWAISGQSKDEDFGAPLWGKVYETAGTYSLRVKVKSSTGDESTISLQVVVTSRPTATNLTGGTYSSLSSNTHYSLNKGSDYNIDVTGLHNVVFTAVGSGADPTVDVVLENRISSNTAGPPARAANIRFVDCDILTAAASTMGFDFCAFVNGRVRQWNNNALYEFDYTTSNVDTANELNSFRYPRGLMFWNTGTMNSLASNDYVLTSDGMYGMHVIGTILHGSGSSPSQTMRGKWTHTTFRHGQMYTTNTSQGPYTKWNGLDTHGFSTTIVPWRDDDLVADGLSGSGGQSYPYEGGFAVVEQMLFGGASDVSTTAGLSSTSQNNVAEYNALAYHAYENIKFYRASGGFGADFAGKGMSSRNIRFSSGAGGYISGTDSQYSARIASGYDGPYLRENANTRPVPSSF